MIQPFCVGGTGGSGIVIIRYKFQLIMTSTIKVKNIQNNGGVNIINQSSNHNNYW